MANLHDVALAERRAGEPPPLSGEPNKGICGDRHWADARYRAVARGDPAAFLALVGGRRNLVSQNRRWAFPGSSLKRLPRSSYSWHSDDASMVSGATYDVTGGDSANYTA